MSWRVRASAVAVTASRGTPGKISASRPSMRYSGRKSWPHWLTQCASSIATSARDRPRQPLQHGGLHQAFGREVEQVERRPRRSAARCRRASRHRCWNRASPPPRPTAAGRRPDRPSARSAARRRGRARAGPARGSGSTGSCRRRWEGRRARCVRPAPRRSRQPAGRGSPCGRKCRAARRARSRARPAARQSGMGNWWPRESYEAPGPELQPAPRARPAL